MGRIVELVATARRAVPGPVRQDLLPAVGGVCLAIHRKNPPNFLAWLPTV